jgi:glycerol transport system ATP-binding protein
LVTELSGSESVVHFAMGEDTWVSQSHGIHPFEIGAEAELFMDAGRFFYFGADDSLVAA